MVPSQMPSMTSMIQQQQPPAGGAPPQSAQPQPGAQTPYYQSFQQPQFPQQPQSQPQYPTFQQRPPAVNLPQGQQPAQSPYYTGQPVPAPAPSAPFGGVVPPPVGPGPAGGVPTNQPTPNQYVQMLEAQNRIPRGRFASDQDLIEGLYSISEELATQLDSRQPGQSPGQQAPPPAPVPPVPAYLPQGQGTQTSPAEVDYSAVVPVFQSQGWLTMQNGQWSAANPVANDAAAFLNRKMAQTQALQAEMSANPNGFIQKYGADVFKQQLSPLEQQLKQIQEDNQRLHQQVQSLAPQPHRDWVAQNENLLWSKDPAGQRVPTQAGAAYRDAWSLAQNGGVADAATLHQIALMAVQPFVSNTPQQGPPPSWAQTVAAQQRPFDPSFTAPGSQTPQYGQQNSAYGGIPTDNSGFPSFAAMTALANQAGV